MSVLTRWAGTALLAAALAVAPIMVAPAHAEPGDADVYTTPGGHFTNGRYWKTDCEMYSSNVVRCRTDIWAYTIESTNGAYRRVEGWAFNNLTYLPSPRASWANNNLAKNVEWTNEGRKWRTECDTPATGRGGCRSFLWTKQVRTEALIGVYGQVTGYTFVPFEGWVFNNITRFSTTKTPAVSAIPADVLDQSQLTWDGFGPLKPGAQYARLKDMGYMTNVQGPNDCGWLSPTDALVRRGLRINAGAVFLKDRLYEMHLMTPFGVTIDGARVGMTFAEVKSLYGNRMTVVGLPNGSIGYQEIQVGKVTQGEAELLFLFHENSTAAVVDSDKVTRIILRKPTSFQIDYLCLPGDKWDHSGDPGYAEKYK